MPGELAPWSPTPAQASARGRGPRLGTHTVTGEGRHTSHWGPMVLGQPTSRPAPGGRDLVSVLKPRPQGDLCRGNGMWLQAGSEGTRLLPCSLDQQLRGAPAACLSRGTAAAPCRSPRETTEAAKGRPLLGTTRGRRLGRRPHNPRKAVRWPQPWPTAQLRLTRDSEAELPLPNPSLSETALSVGKKQ